MSHLIYISIYKSILYKRGYMIRLLNKNNKNGGRITYLFFVYNK